MGLLLQEDLGTRYGGLVELSTVSIVSVVATSSHPLTIRCEQLLRNQTVTECAIVDCRIVKSACRAKVGGRISVGGIVG